MNGVAWRVVAFLQTVWFTNNGGFCVKENAPPAVDIINDILLLNIDVAW